MCAPPVPKCILRHLQLIYNIQTHTHTRSDVSNDKWQVSNSLAVWQPAARPTVYMPTDYPNFKCMHDS